MMAKIDLNTPQNVIISYDLASFWSRLLAMLIDNVLRVFLFWLFLFIGFSGRHTSSLGEFIWIVILIMTVGMYYLFSEMMFNGQTLGKMALGIRSLRLDGEKMSWEDGILRWALRLVDMFGIGALLILTSEHNQRLGGMLSDTIVVTKKPSLEISFKRLMGISSLDKYTPVFEDVIKLREKDLLTAKRVLDRFKKYGNTAHKQAMKLCAKKIKTLLDIQTDMDDHKFIQTIIKDYIVMTR